MLPDEPRTDTSQRPHQDEPVLSIRALSETLIDQPLYHPPTDCSFASFAQLHAEALLQALLDQSDEAILSTCPEGRIRHWNAAAERLYGYSPAEALHQPLTLLSPPEEHQLVWQNLDQLRQGQPIAPREQIDHHRQGYAVPTQRHWFRLADPQGHFLGAGVCARPMRPATSGESATAPALSLALLAHDLNNLLTIIHSGATLLQKQPLDSALARQSLEQILQAVHRAIALTENCLQAARRANSAAPPVTVLDLNERLTSLQGMFQQILGEAIQLQIHPTQPLPPVQVEESGLEQALLNLVINARQAMPTGGQLTIETAVLEQALEGETAPESYVVVVLRDTGIGMSMETQSQLFTPYFTTRPGRGTGLGLASVAAFVRRSRGHLRVESQSGVGTCFRLFFPIAGGCGASAG